MARSPFKPDFYPIALSPKPSAARTPEELYRSIFGVMPVIVQETPQQAPETFQVDPELARLSVALHLAPALRIWVIIRQCVREQSGSGWISRDALRQALKAQQIPYTDRHLRRVLVSGEGTFWNVTRQRIYMRSWTYVAVALTGAALQEHTGRPERNRPGAREMYVPVSGSLEQWEAQLYAAWFAYRNNPTISRSELCHLFKRDKTTLRRWEATRLVGCLTVRRNYAQCPNFEAFYRYIPHYATRYAAQVRWKGAPRKIARIRWQLPNTYQAGAIKQHHKKGQASKVRRRVNALPEIMPADERRGGWHRLYFDQPETLRKFVRRHPEAEARYVWRGENRYRHGIFEINESGFPLTHRLERARHTDEQEFFMVQEWRMP
ncbi:MAG: hypothetical protein ABI700_04090 [Chloroflexota bacterium]